jgi:hypothetical protein
VGKLDSPLVSIWRADLARLKLDGFFGQGAHLFANDAVNVVSPGNAAIFINVRFTHNLKAFFL